MLAKEWNPSDHDEEMLSFCKTHQIQLQAHPLSLVFAIGTVPADPHVRVVRLLGMIF